MPSTPCSSFLPRSLTTLSFYEVSFMERSHESVVQEGLGRALSKEYLGASVYRVAPGGHLTKQKIDYLDTTGSSRPYAGIMYPLILNLSPRFMLYTLSAEI